MIRREFNLNVSNGWFFVEDSAISDRPYIYWGEEQDANHLATARGVIAIGTPRREGVVPVAIEIRKKEPSKDFHAWDHVVDCSIDISSGVVIVSSTKDAHLHEAISLTAGIYRTRIFYGDIDGVDTFYESYADDHYCILLWPGESQSVKALKRRKYRHNGQIIKNRYRDTLTVSELSSMLNSGDVGERVHAARSLGIIGDMEAFKPITTALKDENVCVRRAATSAMGGFGTEGLLLVVELLYAEENKDLWPRAERIISSVRDFQKIKILVAAMLARHSERLSSAVWSAINEIDGLKVINKVLKPMLDDPDKQYESRRQRVEDMIKQIQWYIDHENDDELSLRKSSWVSTNNKPPQRIIAR